MGDEMSKDLTTATVEETTAIKDYEFAAAKKKDKSSFCVVHVQNLD